MENEILQTLEFKLLESPSLLIFVEFLSVKLNFHNHENFPQIQKILIYVTKMIMHDYDLLIGFPMKYLGASCIYICLKIMEQILEEIETKQIVEKLKLIFSLEE